jgi:hypothetical protein
VLRYTRQGNKEKEGQVVEENTDMMRFSSSISAFVCIASCTCKGEEGLEVGGSREARAWGAHDNNIARGECKCD